MMPSQSINIMAGVRNKRQQPLYDSKSVAAAATTTTKIQFFAQTEAANGVETTNLRRANQLEQGEKFTCFGIGFECVKFDRTDFWELIQKFALQFIVSKKVRWQGPISQAPAGGGPAATSITTVAATTIYDATNGVPSQQAIMAFSPEYAIPIEGGQIFSAELVGTAFTATAAMFMRCYLFGVLEDLVSYFPAQNSAVPTSPASLAGLTPERERAKTDSPST